MFRAHRHRAARHLRAAKCRLIHPDDGDLMAVVDRCSRQARRPSTAFPHAHDDGAGLAAAELRRRRQRSAAPGIAVDVTEQMPPVERSKTADIRPRDAIETI
jgi:hypothetical protein